MVLRRPETKIKQLAKGAGYTRVFTSQSTFASRAADNDPPPILRPAGRNIGSMRLRTRSASYMRVPGCYEVAKPVS
jgi:hypothetical protein